MNRFLLLFLIFTVTFTRALSQPESPQKSLNQYVEFLNQSVDALASRFQMIRNYQYEVDLYKKKPDFLLKLSSTGPLEEYFYQKALTNNGLTPSEKQLINTGTKTIWQLLTQLDQTGKALETYVNLKSYQTDNLKQSDAYISDIQLLFKQFSNSKTVFYQQIQKIYNKYQSYLNTDPYLNTQKKMEQVLLSQQQLLDSLPYYLNENNRFNWPVGLIQQSMLADENLLRNFEVQQKITYPASDAVTGFKSALLAIQTLKSQALDDHNFAAQQSSQHGNKVYLSLINQYNKDLLAHHKAFVNYSQTVRHLLDYPAFSPVFTQEPSTSAVQTTTKTQPFQDKPILAFSTKRAVSPASPAMLKTLNDYVEFINESLRQMHLLQMLLRNYQASAEYHREPSGSQHRAELTYSHENYKVPISTYQLLINSGSSLPQPYRAAITSQAEVLLNILQEMDRLSIELISYTTKKKYLNDRLMRSDVILDRYAVLFDIFDSKKEQLYVDIRRIHESYPNINPASSWYVSGTALLKTLDNDKEILFGVKSWLKGEITQLPLTDKLERDARQLIADKYQNLKGLQRFGRSNGLCPYSPYEDLAGNSSGFAEKSQKVKAPSLGSTTHPYESFYFFYNNQLVYQFNKFCELAANAGLLKAVNQPDVFAFRRLTPLKIIPPSTGKTETIIDELVISQKPVSADSDKENFPTEKTAEPLTANTGQTIKLKHDTIYVERVRIDTVYMNRETRQPETPGSLAGFAANNMVLLLDVSNSMNSPYKLPLLKRSIKSLLTLLRPEDQLSIVVYSGKAQVILKPTSGSNATEIARVIDQLQPEGDTDGNEGLRLAYKVANKQYIRSGNNRIILATDGEFPVSEEMLRLIGENARQDVYLTIFTFGLNPKTGQKLQKLSQLGQGTYAHVTAENAGLQLIIEAQAKKQSSK